MKLGPEKKHLLQNKGMDTEMFLTLDIIVTYVCFFFGFFYNSWYFDFSGNNVLILMKKR